MPTIPVVEDGEFITNLELARKYYEMYQERWDVIFNHPIGGLGGPFRPEEGYEAFSFWRRLQKEVYHLAGHFGETEFWTHSDPNLGNPEREESKPWYTRITHTSQANPNFPAYTWGQVTLHTRLPYGKKNRELAWPRPDGFTRKRPKEIYHLNDLGEPGEKARFLIFIGRPIRDGEYISFPSSVDRSRIQGALNEGPFLVTQTSTPLDQRKYRNCYMKCVAPNQWEYDPTNLDGEMTIITEYGLVELGDYLGAWIPNEIAAAMRLMRVTLYDYLRLGFKTFTSISSFGGGLNADTIKAGVTGNFGNQPSGEFATPDFSERYSWAYEVVEHVGINSFGGGGNTSNEFYHYAIYNSSGVYELGGLPEHFTADGHLTLYVTTNGENAASYQTFGIGDFRGKLHAYASTGVTHGITVGSQVGDANANPQAEDRTKGYTATMYSMIAWEFNWI